MRAKSVVSFLLLPLCLAPMRASTVTHSNVSYGKHTAEVMDIYVPSAKGDHPTIVLIHGGGWISGDKQELTSIAQFFAGQGYTAANINYQLATSSSNQYPTAVNDVSTAISFLQKNASTYQVESSEIVAFGTSAGANLALTAGTSGLVQFVVDFYGPTDFTDTAFWADTFDGETNLDILQTYLGTTFTKDPNLYANASPINNLTKKMPPTIIFQGSDDMTVPEEQSQNLYNQLQDLRVTSALYIEKGLGHGFLTSSGYNATPVLDQCISFLKSNMK